MEKKRVVRRRKVVGLTLSDRARERLADLAGQHGVSRSMIVELAIFEWAKGHWLSESVVVDGQPARQAREASG